MSLVLKPVRYAHPEGHTDVCYISGRNKGLVTSGSDGNLIIYKYHDDPTPTRIPIAKEAITVVTKKGKIIVGTNDKTVETLNRRTLQKAIVTRLSAGVSVLTTNEKSSFIVSGSCDGMVKVTNLEKAESFVLTGHTAPILGLSVDPKDELVASSSGDGTIKIWSIKDKKLIHTWKNVVPVCNTFSTAKAYCTPVFEKVNGDYLAVLNKKIIHIMQRSSWVRLSKLESFDIKANLNICKFSECGNYLAASSVYGEVIVWNVESKEQVGYVEHHSNAKITSMAWNPKEPNEIAYCDALGQLGCIEVHTIGMETIEVTMEKAETLIAQLDGSIQSLNTAIAYTKLILSKSTDYTLVEDAKDLLYDCKEEHEKLHQAINKKVAYLCTTEKIEELKKAISKSFKIILEAVAALTTGPHTDQ